MRRRSLLGLRAYADGTHRLGNQVYLTIRSAPACTPPIVLSSTGPTRAHMGVDGEQASRRSCEFLRKAGAARGLGVIGARTTRGLAPEP